MFCHLKLLLAVAKVLLILLFQSTHEMYRAKLVRGEVVEDKIKIKIENSYRAKSFFLFV
jgi:hypothetical protein